LAIIQRKHHLIEAIRQGQPLVVGIHHPVVDQVLDSAVYNALLVIHGVGGWSKGCVPMPEVSILDRTA
jgi:hypothetical protein